MRNRHKPSSDQIPNDLVSNGNLIPNDPGFPPIRRLEADDVRGCCTLSLDRRWWPERDKWALLLDAADGWGIDAPDGQGLAGTVVLTRWGNDYAAIGMMITATRYGGQGLGRTLMEHALDAAGAGTAVSLYATGPGRPLYEKLGFKPVRRSTAFRGQFRASSPASGSGKNEVRVVTEADLPAILALDRVAYGADRERMLTRLPAFADRFIVLEGDEGIVGYAAAWRTEPWMVIGPLMAPDDEAAKVLITDLATHSTVPVRLDLDPDRAALVGWLRARGLLVTEHTVVMTRGDRVPRGVRDGLYTPISVAMA